MTEESNNSQTQSGRVWEIVKILVPSVVTALAGFVGGAPFLVEGFWVADWSIA